MEQATLSLLNKGLDLQLKGDIAISITDSVAIDFIISAIKIIRQTAPEKGLD